jgi:hypothetical protein
MDYSSAYVTDINIRPLRTFADRLLLLNLASGKYNRTRIRVIYQALIPESPFYIKKFISKLSSQQVILVLIESSVHKVYEETVRHEWFKRCDL